MNVDEIVKDITDRFAAVDAQLSAENIRKMVTESLADLKDDDPVVRKMRWGNTAADEKLVGSKYARWGLNAADIEFAYDVINSARGLPKAGGGTCEGASEELTNAFKAVSGAYYMSDEEVRSIDKQAIDHVYPRIPKREFQRMSSAQKRGYMTEREHAIRAATMDTTQSGFGTQLVGAQYVGDMWDAAFQTAVLLPQLATFEMTAPTAYLPVAVDMPEPIFVAESTSDVLATAQYPTVRTGSNRVTVTAQKLIIHQVWSGEMQEDSIINLVPYYRQQIARSLAFYGDSLVINGDTATGANTNINLDDGTPGSTKYYLAANGARKVGLIDNTANSLNVSGAVTLKTLRTLKSYMLDSSRNVDWGHPVDANDLLFLADPTTADQIATLDELLLAKSYAGMNSGFLNSQVSSFIGNPVISTTAVPLTDSTGLVSGTGANNTKGQIVAINKNAYVIGWRRRLQIETERIPASDQYRLVCSFRIGIGRYTPNNSVAGQEHSAVAYDISL
jgi:HK97 family phage major capsid protein